MNEKKYESTFIPCGDALEKMNEIGNIRLEYEGHEQERKNEENPEISD